MCPEVRAMFIPKLQFKVTKNGVTAWAARSAIHLVSTVREKRAQRVLTKANKSDHMHTGEIVESSSSIMGPYVTLLELFPSLESLLTLFKKDKINLKQNGLMNCYRKKSLKVSN